MSPKRDTTVSTTVVRNPSRKVPAAAFLSRSFLSAPKLWETMMEKPLVRPCRKPMSSVLMAVVAPTAAREDSPSVLPTILVSARL